MTPRPLPQQTDDLWEQAIQNVDARCGYAMEWAPSQAAHREAYAREVERLRTALEMTGLEQRP